MISFQHPVWFFFVPACCNSSEALRKRPHFHCTVNAQNSYNKELPLTHPFDTGVSRTFLVRMTLICEKPHAKPNNAELCALFRLLHSWWHASSDRLIDVFFGHVQERISVTFVIMTWAGWPGKRERQETCVLSACTDRLWGSPNLHTKRNGSFYFPLCIICIVHFVEFYCIFQTSAQYTLTIIRFL